MKCADFGILGAILFLCLFLSNDLRMDTLSKISSLQLQYNNAVDNAVEAALMNAVESDSGRDIFVNREEVMKRFLTGLYINFGGMDYPDKKILLEACVPVAAFVDMDRVSFTYLKDGIRCWEEAVFRERYGAYTVDYTLKDYVFVTDERSKKRWEGDYHDVREYAAVPVFGNGTFEEEKCRVILGVILEHMETMIKEHNKYAAALGITYHFSLPSIKKEEWYRTIGDISFLAVFQGYPYGNRELGYFNKIAVGGARIRKDEKDESEFNKGIMRDISNRPVYGLFHSCRCIPERAGDLQGKGIYGAAAKEAWKDKNTA